MGNNRLNSLKRRVVFYRIAGLLRWLFWTVKYAVIWPLATTAIVVILLFRAGDITPGQQMAQEIARVRAMAPSGMFPVRDCPDPVFTVPSPAPENLPSLTENCPLKITGAEEYATNIDQSLSQTGWLLWGMLALLYTAVAVMTGDRPYRPCEFKYGILRANGQIVYSGNKNSENEGDKNGRV
ncbi:conjugal transfer protein TraP [Salmonella enterica subsp. enterica serovar Oranienburg]|nr:conjugal transfer protein TraP [Salmonella enterica subsp. enterica serovar Oranienburg]HAK8204964.1 conjugal transfer protein TraP [Salmonella enterica]